MYTRIKDSVCFFTVKTNMQSDSITCLNSNYLPCLISVGFAARLITNTNHSQVITCLQQSICTQSDSQILLP